MDINEQDIRKFYNFLGHQKQTEIRGWKIDENNNTVNDSIKNIYVNTENDFVDEIKKLNKDSYDVYVGIRERTLNGSKRNDVISSGVIFIDTDNDKEGKIKNQVLELCKKYDISISLVGFSGGGYHLYIKHTPKTFIDNEDRDYYQEQLLEKFKVFLLNNNINVDIKVFDLPRISRVLGSFSHKRNVLTKIELLDDTININTNTKNLVSLLEKVEVKYTTQNEDLSWINEFISSVIPKWKKGNRQDLALSTAGYLRKEKRLGLKTVKNIISRICEEAGDDEKSMRIKAVDETFKDDESKIKGASGLIESGIKIKKDPLPKYLELTSADGTPLSLKVIKARILDLLISKRRNQATEVAVQYILQNNYIYTTRNDNKSEIWIYKEGIYLPEGRTYIKEIIREILQDNYTSNFCGEVTNKIEADTYINSDDFFINIHVDEVPVQNGILNVITRELTEFTPKKVFFNKLPVTYDPSQKCKKIDKFLTDVLRDIEDKKVMYEIFGFILFKDYFLEKGIMMIGDGRNGKSKTIELIKRLIGIENCTGIPLSSLKPDSFSISELFGKLVNLAGDISSSDLRDTDMFKSLTGRDTISAQRKFLNQIKFQNYAKMIFACNELPKVYDPSFGFWDRWILLEFPYTFIEEDKFNQLDNKNGYKIRDPNIIDKISTPEELSGLLNKSLDGLETLIENKKFSYTTGTQELKEKWVRKADSFMSFCMDYVEENPLGKISKKELRKIYHKYCKKHNVRGVSDISIKVTLQENFGATDEYIVGDSGRQEYCWLGINFKKELDFNHEKKFTEKVKHKVVGEFVSIS